MSEDAEESSSAFDVPLLTEASADKKPNHQNKESELESFRHQWKEELKAVSKLQTSVLNTARKSYTDIKNASSIHSIPVNTNVTDWRSKQQNLPSVPENDRKDETQGEDSRTGIGVNDNVDNSLKKKTSCLSEEDKEQLARRLYIKGVELERSGKLYEAIQQYRRAMQLVPDIESKASHQVVSNETSDVDSEEEDDADGSIPALEMKLFKKLSSLLTPTSPVCEPVTQSITKGAHISHLPRELLEYILLWVLSSDLDTRSIQSLSAVSRGFYVITKSESLWKKACHRVWGENCSQEHDSWREMFLCRPQPRYNGCYISKTTYFRSGECNFHDSSYQPWHIVNYYRLLRFFPGGTVLMLTTSDHPQSAVGHLVHKDPKHSQVLVGKYTLEGAIVNLEFVRYNSSKKVVNNRRLRRQAGQGTTDVEKTSFHINMELLPARKGVKNWFLWWRHYTITSHHYSGLVRPTNVDVGQLDTFPQLAFSRVKSYLKESTEPLM